MKKTFLSIFTLLICAFLIFSLAGCLGDTEPDGAPTTSPAIATGSIITPENAGNNDTTKPSTNEGTPVDASYFDDAAFVGDSVSLKLEYYCSATGALGNAQFFTSGSLGSGNALWEVSDESVHPSYRGEKMLIEDCIAKSGAKKVYIMLGMNDLGMYGIDDTLVNYETLTDRILEKSPGVKIIIESMTPMTETSNILGASLNNENIITYNNRLKDFAEDKGYGFVDIASVMYAEGENSLRRDYCSDPDDMGVHFTESGCEAWVNYLKTHTN
ncbi:MAG: GDSL-type esterase/lipase family protein [Eubacteriales bacterium]|nr:GDSL-type esterase/lipase family protein [Eubacteriales bacterium]